MKRLVYQGAAKGFQFVETAETPAVVADQPRGTQRVRLWVRPMRMDHFKPVSMKGNGYRPGKLLDLGPDQCRYTLDDGNMCGRKGFPWCPHHHRLTHTSGTPVVEQPATEPR